MFSFGSTQAQQPATATGFSFGQPTAGSTTFGQPAASTTGFGQPAANTTGFGQPAANTTGFGQPAAGAVFGGQTTFGQPSGSSTFGTFGSTAASQAPAATGGFSFGQQTATAAPSFGSAFGTTTTSAPSFGTAFGTTTSSAPSFGTAFGTATTSAPATAFSFGQPQTTTATSGTGFGGFSGFGSFGSTATTTTAGSGFSFSQPATSFSQFGAAPTTTASSGFSFSSTFGQPNASTTLPSFGGFGSNTGTGFGLGNYGQMQQQQQQQQLLQGPQIDENQALQQSIFQVCKFGDERDNILAKLNYLQACWGCGKGYYSQGFPPVTYTPSNPFYRFKAVGYAYIFTDSNEDGNIVMTVKKPQAKVEAEESNVINTLQMMVARPHIMFKITGMKAISEELTQIVFHAEDKNTMRRIPATDMVSHITQPHMKSQLDNLAVDKIFPKVRPSPEQMQHYLDNPPEGIDPRVWRKAQEDNPDPSIMIPIPMLGMNALKDRIEGQKSETKQHHERIHLISDEISKLQQRHSNVSAELTQLRRKHAELAHRALAVICRQEMMRKQGMTIQAEEEQLKEQLEKIDEDFNSPTQFKGRLNELLSQIRLRKAENDIRGATTRYSIDSASLLHIKEFLGMQQESLNHLVETTRNDSDVVQAIRKSACGIIASKKMSM